MLNKLRSSLALKITILLVVMVVICALLVGFASYWMYRNDNIDSNANRALAVAQSAAAAIDADEFVAIMASGEETDYWYSAKDTLDEIKQRTMVKYLYVLDANYTDSMTYFAEGYDPEYDVEEEYGLGVQEALMIDGEDTYADEMFVTLNTGWPTVTDTYMSGDFGVMVSGFAAIQNDAGEVVGVVGVDITLSDIMVASNNFALRILIIIAVFCVLAALFSVWYINRRIGKPVRSLTLASDKMSKGDIDVHLDLTSKDEIGRLARSFENMAEHTRNQAHLLERLAEGDLTMHTTPRSEQDLMSHSLQKTLQQLNHMFQEIRMSSQQVSMGADQIASGAQMLASGSTQQAATLQEFSASIHDVLQQSQENTRHASSTYDSTLKVGGLMAEGVESMEQLTASMKDISDSSSKIAGVIKVVDDIAFQTNILALNAAVEAARAGQHGKGFAVVADEVRSLAAKSAQAAQETSAMIEDSIHKVSTGTQLAQDTREKLQSVSEIATINAQAMEQINSASDRQSLAISEITTGIGELSNVVQGNSAAAEQSAAAAQEMSSQAQMLNAIVEQFRLKETDTSRQLPGRQTPQAGIGTTYGTTPGRIR